MSNDRYKRKVEFHMGREHHKAANRALDRAIAEDVDVAWAWRTKGKLCMLMERYDAAEKCLEKSEEFDPKSAELHSLLGLLHLHKKEFENAHKSFKKALKLDPKEPDAKRMLEPDEGHHERAKKLADEGRYDEALKYFDYALAQNPGNYWALFDKGKVLAELDYLDEAEICFTEAGKEMKPKEKTWLYSQMAMLLAKRRKHEDARDYALKSLKLDPGNFEASKVLDYYSMPYEDRAKELKKTGKQQEALKEYEKAIEMNPHNYWLKFDMAKLLTMIGRLDTAEKVLLEVQEEMPLQDQTWIYSQRAQINLAKGRDKLAMRLARKAINIDQDNVDARNILGRRLPEMPEYMGDFLLETGYNATVRLENDFVYKRFSEEYDQKVRERTALCQQLGILIPEFFGEEVGEEGVEFKFERVKTNLSSASLKNNFEEILMWAYKAAKHGYTLDLLPRNVGLNKKLEMVYIDTHGVYEDLCESERAEYFFPGTKVPDSDAEAYNLSESVFRFVRELHYYEGNGYDIMLSNYQLTPLMIELQQKAQEFFKKRNMRYMILRQYGGEDRFKCAVLE